MRAACILSLVTRFPGERHWAGIIIPISQVKIVGPCTLLELPESALNPGAPESLLMSHLYIAFLLRAVSLFLACPQFPKARSLPVLSRKEQAPCLYTHTHTHTHMHSHTHSNHFTHSLTHSVTPGLHCLLWSPRRVATPTWIGPKLWGDLTGLDHLFLTCTSSLKSLSLSR